MLVRSRLVLFVVALAAGSLVAPTPRAEAQSAYSSWSLSSGGSWDLGSTLVPIMVGSCVAGAAELVLIVADLYSWGAQTPFDDGWAIFDIIMGSLWTTAGAIGAVWYVTVEQGVPGALGGGGLAVGALHIAHGVWSLAKNGRPPPVAPAVSVNGDGATITLVGSF